MNKEQWLDAVGRSMISNYLTEEDAGDGDLWNVGYIRYR